MFSQKDIILGAINDKKILLDVFYLHTSERKPVIIYSHGFNGFKDWGNFDLIAKQFASSGFVFIKFNFSHNGTSEANVSEFVDLESYANNNYSIQLDDLKRVLDWVSTSKELSDQVDINKIALLGHSLGGGISIIKAAEDSRVKCLVTWASVAECKTPWSSWPSRKMQTWKDNGTEFIINARTKQQMPLKYQLFEDYENNKERMNIKEAVGKLNIPFLICHGTDDSAVGVEKAYLLHEWSRDGELFLVESDHVFGRKHPWESAILPNHMQTVVEKSIEFCKMNL